MSEQANCAQLVQQQDTGGVDVQVEEKLKIRVSQFFTQDPNVRNMILGGILRDLDGGLPLQTTKEWDDDDLCALASYVVLNPIVDWSRLALNNLIEVWSDLKTREQFKRYVKESLEEEARDFQAWIDLEKPLEPKGDRDPEPGLSTARTDGSPAVHPWRYGSHHTN